MVSGPSPWSINSFGPPCSQSSWRHRPQGSNGSPLPSTQASATSRPPPPACNADTSPHSAHKARPYEAFSTLQPTITRPSSTSAAAPTGNSEYGAYARCIAATAAARNAAQSRSARRADGLDTAMPPS
jgi:hypothetical protein